MKRVGFERSNMSRRGNCWRIQKMDGNRGQQDTDEQVFDEVVCGSHPSESESFYLLTFC